MEGIISHKWLVACFLLPSSTFDKVQSLQILSLIKQTPILDLERLPNLGRELDRITNQLALLAQFQVHVLLVVLALDVRDVDGNEYIGIFLFEPHERQDDGRKVGRGASGFGFVDVGRLGRNEGIRWDFDTVKRKSD